MKFKFIIIFFTLFYSVHGFADNLNNQKKEDNKIFKIDDTIFVLESMFLPGAGHLYNNHYRSAFLSFFTNFSFLINTTSRGHDYFNRNDYFKEDSNDFIDPNSPYRYYNDKNEIIQDRKKSNTFLMLFLFSYFDAIIDSYFASNKNFEDSALFFIGLDASISAIKTDSMTFKNTNDSSDVNNIISKDQTSKESINLVFASSYGYLINKDLFLSLGPQFIFTYDMSYDFVKFKYFSFFVANHFDMQFQMYEFLDDGTNSSFDNYETFNDFFVFGAKLYPYKGVRLDCGFSFFTVTSTWDSFSGQEDNNFAQAHSSSNGFFNGEYYFLSSNVFFTKSLRLGMKLKFYFNKENKINYENKLYDHLSYFKMIRANIFINYVF